MSTFSSGVDVELDDIQETGCFWWWVVEKNPVSLRKWWQNSQKKDKGLAENAGKKQGFSAGGENGLEGQELEV